MSEAKYRQAERALWQHYGLEPSERHVELAELGARIRVQQLGEGEPVLMLHGTPTAGTTFAPLVPHMAGLRCLIPDLPPGGLSDPLTLTAGNVGAVVDRLVTDLLDALDVERAHVVGSSAGSFYAMHAGHRTPERVGRVVHLGAPWLVAGIDVPRTEKLLLLPGVRTLAASMTPGRRMQVSMLKSIGHAQSIEAGRIPSAYWEWYDALLRETDTYGPQIKVLAAFKGKGLAYDPRLVVDDEILRLQGPTHVIWGDQEALATLEDASSLVDRIPAATLEVIEGAGHLPWLDFPERVAASTRTFLQAGD